MTAHRAGTSGRGRRYMAGASAQLKAGVTPGLRNSRRRARTLFLITIAIFTVFAGQLVQLQGLQADSISHKAKDLRQGTKTLPAVRGQITDDAGVVIAASVERRTVVACPKLVKDYTRKDGPGGVEGVAQQLSPLLGVPVPELVTAMTPKNDADCYRVIKKGLEPLQWRKVAEKELPGVTSETAQQRTYPAGPAMAPLVGWVGSNGGAQDGSGGGLELLFNKQLSGTPGALTAEYAATGQEIPMTDRQVLPAVPGRNVRLTIDSDLQWYAYNAVAAQVKESKAESGYVVVMDKKGRLKAAAQYPSFDPTNIGAGGVMGALPFQDTFEPGSTAKVMSIGTSLDHGVTSPTTQYVVPGALARPQVDFTIHDAHPHGELNLTTTGILAVSSNIGTSMIAEKLSPQVLYQAQRNFGMGDVSAANFPGESPGIIARPDRMSGSQRYTVMYGQGISTTAVQAVGVFQAVANGGMRIPPTLVAGMTGADGTFASTPTPPGTRALKPETSTTLLKMMENVTTEGGTAVGAEIPGYRIAGKTGTADIPVKGGYKGVVASFIGIAPADNPELICGVFLRLPNGEGAGSDTAPTFKRIMTYALQKMRVPPTGATAEPFPNYWGPQASKNQTR
ncbi:penicillin-binding protein 2 [Austwickia sp. TVS 96-490-7B]|uniref:peptidoglycan D,D-transpeptidase FtsI family protein n=1 Tax=Austwickia sp. TVS 96-490-7B TaxID=2830843 RepID=UPI001C583086|nr:penicillin-binding protein 2 [Austwickia sp. TVS 96-490-7B]